MAKAALIGLSFGKGRGGDKPPRFQSEGEPETTDSRGADGGEMPDDASAEVGDKPGMGGGDHADHAELALDDMADILGVSPEDRKDFGAAMAAFVHATLLSVPDDGGGEEPAPEATEDEEAAQ